MATNREICALFFKTKDQGVFLCQLCGASRKQQLGSGYSNLMSHLISTYPGFEETYHSSVATDPPHELWPCLRIDIAAVPMVVVGCGEEYAIV
ncbi:hypothetical protein PF003_g9517 [Phytophthora fragariae]|nr:hypothetical protein PF003_g9517 [Phytophthora fragariae]